MKPQWNYQPAEAWRGSVIVGKSPVATWWCAGLLGQRRKCVRVRSWDKEFFYLDDEDGSGSRKVFERGGGPDSYSAHIPVDDDSTFTPIQ